jgi:uncharacterized protein
MIGAEQNYKMNDSAFKITDQAQEIIGEMVRRIVERFHPEKIILFGSYARGTAGPDSDVDLLVVMPVSGSRRQLAVEIQTSITGMGLPKDVIVVTPEEVERDRNLVGTIIHPALREGKVLHDRSV